MRKSFFTNQLIFSLTLSIILYSCKKFDTSKLDQTTSIQSGNEDARYLNQRLKQFAISFSPVLQNKQTREIIIDKAKEKFDEEYEVLIRDIFEISQINSVVSKFESIKLHTDLFRRSGQHLYPQIYIPRLQYLEDNPNSKSAVSSRIEEDTTTEEPVYVFYSGNAEVDSADANEVWPGYKLVNDQYVFYTMVDEDYANEHEVWVFSLNESPEYNRQTVPCEIDPCAPGCPLNGTPECGGSGGGGGGIDPTGDPDDDPTDAPSPRVDFPDLGHQRTNFKIHQMRVKDHRERWLAGASEISIKAKLTCHNGRELGQINGQQKEYSSDQYANKLGKLIKKVKRKDIRNLELLTVNYPLQTNWQNQDPNQDPIYFIYTIFERDIFPSTEHRDNDRYCPISLISNQPPPGPFTLFWRSQDKQGQGAPYAKYFFTSITLVAPTANEYAGSGLVQNGSIAFNTVIY